MKGSSVATATSVDLGATGSGGMSSNHVDVTTSGATVTAGGSSQGVDAQSVGGGGGSGGLVQNNIVNIRGTVGDQANISVGGSGMSGGQSNSSFAWQRTSDLELDMVLGVVETDNAGGGDVTLDHECDVSANGELSPGVSVQSIGGRLVSMVTATKRNGAETEAEYVVGRLELGADPGRRNDGGGRDLAFPCATATQGDPALRIVVQSIGAGGARLICPASPSWARPTSLPAMAEPLR